MTVGRARILAAGGIAASAIGIAVASGTVPPPSGSCDLNATPATYSSQLSALAGGQTLCLATGSYGSFSGAAKSSMAIIQPQSGATITFSGGGVGSTVRNLTLKNATFTGPIDIVPGGNNLNFVLDGITMGNVGQGTYEGRISIGGGQSTPSGVHILNSRLGPGGCSDGIQISSAYVEVANTEITGIRQSGCTAHVDPVQFYAGDNVNFHDNYLHANDTGIMAPDGSTGNTITNNVIQADTNYDIIAGDMDNSTITHNVAGIDIFDGNPANQPVCTQRLSTNDIYRDNVGSMDGCGTNITNTNNLGSVTFTGGTGRCAFATASPKGTASDGTDIGLNDCP